MVAELGLTQAAGTRGLLVGLVQGPRLCHCSLLLLSGSVKLGRIAIPAPTGRAILCPRLLEQKPRQLQKVLTC